MAFSEDGACFTRRGAVVAGLAASVSACVTPQPGVPASPSLDQLAKRSGRRFGSAVGWGRPGADRGSFANPAYAAILERECSLLVPENELKWQWTRPGAGQFDFRQFDAIAVTEADILGPSESFRQLMDYYAHSPQTAGILERMASERERRSVLKHPSLPGTVRGIHQQFPWMSHERRERERHGVVAGVHRPDQFIHRPHGFARDTDDAIVGAGTGRRLRDQRDLRQARTEIVVEVAPLLIKPPLLSCRIWLLTFPKMTVGASVIFRFASVVVPARVSV